MGSASMAVAMADRARALPPGGEDGCDEDDPAEALLGRAEAALEALMASGRGRRHEHLAPEPGEALLALLGHPPDGRDDWQALARDLRERMLLDEGLVAGG